MFAQAPPPADLEELRRRARALTGLPLSALAPDGAHTLRRPSTHRKGKTGALLEQVLGARAGNHSGPDFPDLGVELKTIPIDARGRPRESTFVCAFSLASADRARWETSAAREKLGHVLFVPILRLAARPPHIGRPFFWRPSPAEHAQLAADFEDIMGLVAIGKVEELDARVGVLLQARPKAAHSGVRTRAYGMDGEPIDALPRGFYLRARFTARLLAAGAGRMGASAPSTT